MNLPFIDWIWHVRGSVALAPGQSPDDAFDRLDPLMQERGTSHERSGNTLTFRKKDASAQDKLSVFDGGALQIEQRAAGAVLRYDLTSRILLFCFCLPLLFVGIARLTMVIGKGEQPPEAARTSGKAADASKKPAAKDARKDAAKDVVVPQNPIDKFLGAPAPDKPKKDAEKTGKKPSGTPAYVFAAIFATLYVVGRILEDWLVRRLFRKRLLDA